MAAVDALSGAAGSNRACCTVWWTPVLSVEDRAEIRRSYRAEGLPIKMIARTLGVSRNTVRAAIARG